MIMMRLDDITARGYASYFRRFQILMMKRSALFFARYCSFYINNPLKLSRTAACYSSFARAVGS